MTSTDIAPIAPRGRPSAAAARLSHRQKAAIIVRFLLNEGTDLPLSDLPEPLQEVLTTQIGSMRYVDQATLTTVLTEFAEEVAATGLTFPHGVAGALSALDGRISPQTATRLRKEAGVRQFGDPWKQVCNSDPDLLLGFLRSESSEVAAIILSKLDVTRAATLLNRLPGETARRITYAVSQTGSATPDAVDRIGLSLAAQLHQVPPVAFDEGPEQRVGAILNFSRAATRDDILSGLEEADGDFAKRVRKAIFTFADIPDRIDPADIPTIARELDQPELVAALAAARNDGDDDLSLAADFILDNLSRRMADTLRDEIEESGTMGPAEGEAAMTTLIEAIRALQERGTIRLQVPQDEATG